MDAVSTIHRECMMTQSDTSTWRRRVSRAITVATTSGTVIALLNGGAQAWDYPFDHEIVLDDPNLCTHTTRYDSRQLPWTERTRVLAVQPIATNCDMIVTDDGGTVHVSQLPGAEVEFALFDATTLPGETRGTPEFTLDVYTNGADAGLYYLYYVNAEPIDWDGEAVRVDFNMWYYEMVAARTIYLRAGRAYRFDIDRGDGRQSGFASLMRTDPWSRIQTRPQAVAEFDWRGERHDDFVYVPEEGWYTLVVVQENGDALGLAKVWNTVQVGRGADAVDTNDIHITITVE